MNKKVYSYIVLILLVLNIFAWQEVFALVNSANILEVYFLDVGQGDAAFIETPQHHQILIDGGPDTTVLSKLQKLMLGQDRSIDIVILTHPEKDHFTGLLEVLKRYKVDYVLWTGIVRDTAEYKEWVSILELSKKNGTKVITVKKNQEILAGDAVIDILYPEEDLIGQELKDTSNDSGVVSRLIFGKNSFLFTGDISSKAEKKIIENNNIVSNVLKVAHHGSKYSTSDEFLNNIKPQIAVISVGKDNTYGHPTPEVLQRLDKFGIKVLRTDIAGDIKIISDGSNITINNK